MTGDGVWEFDLETGVNTFSRRFREMYGYDDGELMEAGSLFDDLAHPEDQEQRKRAFTSLVEGRTAGYVSEHRRCKDGSWKWALSRGMVIRRDAQGRALRVIGTHADITARKAAETQLLELNRQLTDKSGLRQSTLSSISQGILMMGADNRVNTYNSRVCTLLDVPESLLENRPTLQEIARFQFERGDFGPNAELVDEQIRSFVFAPNAGVDAPLPAYHLRSTLSDRSLEVRTQTVPAGGMVRTYTDVTGYVQAEHSLKRLHRLLQATQGMANIGGWEIDLRTNKVFWTDEVYRILETSPQQYTPTMDSTARFFTPESIRKIDAAIAEGPMRGEQSDMELEMVTARGRHIWVHSVSTLTQEQGQTVKRTTVIQDITERKHAEALVWQQANFDLLTGLPNRRMLRDRLAQDLRKTARDGRHLAILFVDLDHFKEVNDTLGHDAGDQLLIEAARRISRCVRDSDTVARMEGDEFTLVLSDLHDDNWLDRILRDVLQAMATRFQIGDEQVFVSASIGITIYPTDGQEVETLFKNADQALYVAKGAGRNRFSYFTPSLQRAAQARVRLASDLRDGVAQGQFHLVYQPIVALTDGRVYKAEALLRWNHPTRGVVSPAEFIPIAESTGLIIEMGEWVFRQATAQSLAWRQQHHPDFQVSINLNSSVTP